MDDLSDYLENLMASDVPDATRLGHVPAMARALEQKFKGCRIVVSLLEKVEEQIGSLDEIFSDEEIYARITPGRTLREHGDNLGLGSKRNWLKVMALLMAEQSAEAPPIPGTEWENDADYCPPIELEKLGDWLTLKLRTSRGGLWLGPNYGDCDFDSTENLFAFGGWKAKGREWMPSDSIVLPPSWKFGDEAENEDDEGPSWSLLVWYVLDRMTEQESLKSTANYRDDWGRLFEPSRLASLHNLRSHLTAEEDYFKDPTRRPRLRFHLQEPRNPWQASIHTYLERQRCSPEDIVKLEKAGLRQFSDLSTYDLDELEEQGVQRRTIRLLQTAVDRLPTQEVWDNWSKGRDRDLFRIRLDSTQLEGKGTDFLNDDSVQIEIEELAEELPRRGKRDFRVEVHWYDDEEGIVYLRPDTWQKEKAKRWRNKAPKKGHVRLAAETYQTVRKQQAVTKLIIEKQAHGRTLAQILRDATRLPTLDKTLPILAFNPNLNRDDESGGVSLQLESIKLGVNCPDLGLIRGPPGTGKTTVICEIIQQMISQGKRILMVAPTHVAVDNVLERIGLESSPLFRPGVYPLRQGRKHRVEPELQEFTWDELHHGFRNRLARQLDQGLDKSHVKKGSIIDMQRRWLDHVRKPPKKGEIDLLGKLLRLNLNVICGTTIGISHEALSDLMEIPFDLVICDEASKATLGEFLVPAVRARRWLLVGDEKQLSPYVEQSKLQFIIAHVIWDHFVRELEPRTFENRNGKKVEQPGKKPWVPGLTLIETDRQNPSEEQQPEPYDEDEELKGFFAMKRATQEQFFEAGREIEILLKQWFENRFGWNQRLRNMEDRIISRVLCLRADLVDEWETLNHEKAVKNWKQTCQRIDNNYDKAIEQWKRDCDYTRKEYDRKLGEYNRRKEDIANYPKLVSELRSKAKDPSKFTPPPKPKPLKKPERLREPPVPMPTRGSKPQKPSKPSRSPRPTNITGQPKTDPFAKYYWVPESRDWLHNLWKKLVMISEFEYKSAFEVLIDKMKQRGQGGKQDRIETLTVQYRMRPEIAEFNGQVVYGGKYTSAPETKQQRGFVAKVVGKQLRKNNSLVWLDTSLFGAEADEVERKQGNRHLMENVAEAKVIVQALQDLETTFRNLKPPAGQTRWTVGVIAFYSAQAKLVSRALAETKTFRRISRTRFVFADEFAEVEVNVVDRFQGKERDVVFLSFTRANTSGRLGFLTVINRLNVATTRGRHKLFIVGNKQQLRKMTEIAARKRKRDAEASLAEKEAPRDFVANLLEYVEERGSVIGVDPRRLNQDWKGIPLLAEIGPTKNKSPSSRRPRRSRRRR